MDPREAREPKQPDRAAAEPAAPKVGEPALPEAATQVISTSSPDDLELLKWLENPVELPPLDQRSQPAPSQLADDRIKLATRRSRRVARQSRTQAIGTSAAMSVTLAGCIAAVVLAISQTERVGGSLGIPTIGLFSPSAKSPDDKKTANKPPPRSRPDKRDGSASPQRRRDAAKAAKKSAPTGAAADKTSASSRRPTTPRQQAPTQQTAPQRSRPDPTPKPAPAPRRPAPSPPPKSTAPTRPAPKPPAPKPAAPKPPAPKPAAPKPSPSTGTPALGGEPGL